MAQKQGVTRPGSPGGDGIVDLADLGYWSDYWLTDESDTLGDLSRDTVVDLLDFALLTQPLLQTAWYE